MRSSRRSAHASAVLLAAMLSVPIGLAPAPARAQQLAVSGSLAVVRFSGEASRQAGQLPASLRRTITLRLRRVTLEGALDSVMVRAGITLNYSRAIVPLDRIVSIDVEHRPAIEALRQALAGADVELWVAPDGVMALVPTHEAAGEPPPRGAVQTGTVAGRVAAAGTGEALVGATVSVAGTGLGTVTGADGRYAIRGVAPGVHSVVARRIGFASDSARVTVGADQTVTADFALRAVAVQLNQVVTIGYGTTSRRELTGAVASIPASEIARAPVPNVEQALQGRAPGVQVTTASGQPGTAAAVRIRGGNSITAGNDPLYVIDGVPVTASPAGANTTTLETQGVSGLDPLAALNPNDIASIDVLKDASATAIYGARAANGVILITTKRGRPGSNVVRFGAYYGSQQVRHRLSLLDAQQFATVANEARTNAGQPALYSSAQIAAFGAGTNWQDAIFRTAPVQSYEASIAGGTDATRYYISGNVLRQEGVVLNTNMDRGAVRLNLDQTVSRRFRVGTHFTYSRSQGQVMPNGGAGQEVSSVLINALTAPPTLPVRGSGGEYFIGINPANGRDLANPVASALLITNHERQNRLIGNVFGEYDLLRNLTFRSSLGTDYLTSLQDFYSPSTTYPGITYGGYGSRGTLQATTWLNENTLHYTRGAGTGHALDLLGGVTLQRSSAQSVSGTAQGFVTDALAQNGLNSGSTYLGVWTGAPHSSLLSYFARANWNLADRYLFTVTERIDGSSKFGAGNRYGSFPSAAFAWRLSDEPFMRRVRFFDDLKLRTSYGRTGNQDIGNYRALATLGSSTYLFNGGKVVGYAPNTLANPNLKWETTDQFDAGVDAAMANSRITITADYYNKKTRDLLLEVPVPATLGFTSQLQNIGSVRNRGVELGISTVNLTGALGWTSSLNLAWNRNVVLNIGADSQTVNPVGVGAGANQNPTILKVGQPINSFYGYVYVGMKNGQPTYADLNGDGKVTTADQTIIGSAQPNYTGGFSNQLTYGPFGLSVFLQWSVGNKIYNITRALLTSNAGNANQLTDVIAAGNTGANGIPKPKLGNSYDTRPSTLFVEDGSYLRGKNIRLDYTVPASWLRGMRLRSMTSLQLYVSAQNFFTKTRYTGFDPEVTEYATSVLAQGIDFGTYPQTRQVTVGFNAGF